MKTKILLIAALFLAANIGAQGYYGDDEDSGYSSGSYDSYNSSESSGSDTESSSNYSQSTSSAPEPTPTPVSSFASTSSETSQEASSGDESLNDFNKLHGRAYNWVANQGASLNVNNVLRYPHSMKGRKLVYVEPTLNTALISFGESSTYFVGLDNSGTVGLLTAGLTLGDMGLSLDLGLGKNFISSTSGANEESRSLTMAGDHIGLNFSLPLGDLAFVANAFWRTTIDELSTTTLLDGAESSTDDGFWDLFASAEVKTNEAKDLAWAAGVQLYRHNLSVETKNPAGSATEADENSHIEFAPHFNVSLKALGNSKARVLLGANSTLGFQMFDKIKDFSDGALEIGLFIAPNIFAEIAINKYFMFFSGASHNLNLFAYRSDKIGTTESSYIQMLTEQTFVSVGSRFQWKSIALEASLSDAFINNPFSSFSGSTLAANLGAFIYF